MTDFTLPHEFDLSDHFDHRTLTRAMALQPDQALLSMHVHGEELQTRVRGSGSQVYEQDIRFRVDPRTGLKLLGSCTCPVGANCKHVAAALMAFEARALRARRPGGGEAAANGAAVAPAVSDALPRAVEQWLGELAQAARPAEAAAPPSPSPRMLMYVLVAEDTRLSVHLQQGSVRRSGEVGSFRPHGPRVPDMMRTLPAYVSETDEALFAALLPFAVNRGDAELELRGPSAATTAKQLLQSGRAWLGAAEGPVLPTPPGPAASWVDEPLPVRLQWRADAAGLWRAAWEVCDPALPGDGLEQAGADASAPASARTVQLVLLPAPHAFDLARRTLGPAALQGVSLSPGLLSWLARMPPVPEPALPALVKRLQAQGVAHGVELPLPAALAQPVTELGALQLQPVLRLVTCPNVPAESWLDGHQRPLPAGQPARQAALQVLFRYEPAPGRTRAALPPVEFHFPAGASDTAFVERHDPKRPGEPQLLRFRRDAAAEAEAAQQAITTLDLRPWSRVAGFVLERLAALKGARVQSAVLPAGLEDGQMLLLPIARTQWPLLISQQIPALAAAGWVVERADDFPFQVFEADDFELRIDEDRAGGGDWFKFGLQVTVGGEKVDLVPLLIGLVRAGWLTQGTEHLAPGAEVLVPWPDDAAPTLPAPKVGDSLRALVHGAERLRSDAVPPPMPRERLLRLSAERVAPLVAWLRGVFSAGGANGLAGQAHRVSRFELGALETLGGLGQGVVVKAPPVLTELLEQLRTLRTGEGLPAVAVSPHVAAQLRPYQLDGLAWMDFLRRARFGGVLADDMGLGKTLQTLALLQAELDAGRLDRPCLVVVPTSLLGNWQGEASRFTPQLRTLVLHGKQRTQQFKQIGQAHLVITSYPLAVRDAGVLAEHDWHYLILDEAQRIKNSRSQAALALKGLSARHRLCLSGTPLENHLGELWSLMDFVSPGLLGSETQFREHFRNPVEKRQDALQAEHLARRVRPFILRRTKAQVARDLPEKTETLLRVDLEGTQRDLYETVRATMDGKLREAIARQGLARSQIVVLDALLKLRQVCCDPRLLRSASTPANGVDAPDGSTAEVEDAVAVAPRHSAPSAKLELLLDLLPTLVEDGRRILVFSQFTSMLALIEAELVRLKLGHLKLTGDTTDRAGMVAAFQGGDVPIFLISLKAGGVGLNLTAADTVILYDPWWNPAVEQQAIDRAYRIGQDKPVFVYKLVASGTVEDKMLELQARKAGLADSLLRGVASDAALNAQDFDELFKPLAG